MERYKCRLCFKSFINGRALGGHMRSHMLNHELYQEERLSQLSDDQDTYFGTSSSSHDEFGVLKRNHVDDDESEAEINPTRKRTRKLGSFDLVAKQEQHHSSVSDTTTEEDLAFCLIMLSRDKWKQTLEEEEEEEDEETDYECEEYKSRKIVGGGRGRFKCETCGKVFKSYQALGGHRASHKKNNTFTSTKPEQDKAEFGLGVKEKKVHQCPICFRVFSSGQALGGHKRSHGSNNGGGGLSMNQLVRIDKEDQVKKRMIDLNLPAPHEDDDESSLVFDEW